MPGNSNKTNLDTSIAEQNPQDYTPTYGHGFNLPIFTFDVYLLLDKLRNAAMSGEEINILFIASGSCALAVKAGMLAAQYSNIKITFNDLKKENLDALQAQLPNSENIIYLPGDIFNLDIEKNKYHRVVCHNLLHFFSGKQIETLLRKIYDCLKIAGSLHLVTASPHQNLLKKLNLIKKWTDLKVDNLVDKGEQKEDWPNFFPNYKEQIEKHVKPTLAANLPQQLHFISRKQIMSALARFGFVNIKAMYSKMPDHAPPANQEAFSSDDHKENTSVIAMKGESTIILKP